MAYCLDKEQAVAGYVNTHKDGFVFNIHDVNEYVRSLWNAGCGPIRLNYTQQELSEYLNRCCGVCLRLHPNGYIIDKTPLQIDPTDAEYQFFHGDHDLTVGFALFCKLQVDMRTPDYLLDAMGFRFMHDPGKENS